MVARRQQSFVIEAETVLEFEPDTFQQMAGLVYYYNTRNYYYLRVSHDEELGKCIGIMTCDRGEYDEPLDRDISIEGWERVYLKLEVNYDDVQFYYSRDGKEWNAIGPVLDAGVISDDNALESREGILIDQGFTGAFIGLCAQDMSGRFLHADFDYFAYREKE